MVNAGRAISVKRAARRITPGVVSVVGRGGLKGKGSIEEEEYSPMIALRQPAALIPVKLPREGTAMQPWRRFWLAHQSLGANP
jgi:hypothetical protein